MPRPENPRFRKFAQEYILDGNGKRAAIAAGYAARSAEVTASTLIRNPKVMEILAELRAAATERFEMQADDIARRWIDIAMADPNELMAITVGACRYCHGLDHHFHWRTPREFEDATATAIDKKRTPPTSEGGFGYNSTRDPHPDCPECDGRGQPQAALRDTTKLSGRARALFAGVKETRFGIEIKTNDQMAALDALGRHFGMFRNPEAEKAVGSLADAIAEIAKRGSAAPLAKDDPQEEEVEP